VAVLRQTCVLPGEASGCSVASAVSLNEQAASVAACNESIGALTQPIGKPRRLEGIAIARSKIGSVNSGPELGEMAGRATLASVLALSCLGSRFQLRARGLSNPPFSPALPASGKGASCPLSSGLLAGAASVNPDWSVRGFVAVKAKPCRCPVGSLDGGRRRLQRLSFAR